MSLIRLPWPRFNIISALNGAICNTIAVSRLSVLGVLLEPMEKKESLGKPSVLLILARYPTSARLTLPIPAKCPINARLIGGNI